MSGHRFLRDHTFVELDYPEPSFDRSLNILPQVDYLDCNVEQIRSRWNFPDPDLLLSYSVLMVELPQFVDCDLRLWVATLEKTNSFLERLRNPFLQCRWAYQILYLFFGKVLSFLRKKASKVRALYRRCFAQ